METKVSIDAHVIRRYPEAEALAAVEGVLGAPERWAPSLIEHWLSSDFQADWKLEVGCWLLQARDLGYLDRLEKRLRRPRIEAAQPEVTEPNDSAHRILVQELEVDPIVRTTIRVPEESPLCGFIDTDLVRRMQGARGAAVELNTPAGLPSR